MNWPELIEDVRIELGLLHQLIEESADLVRAVKAGKPSRTECLAAGAALQTFYNGVESIFRLLAERIDGSWDEAAADTPRLALLEAMTRDTDQRKAVIDAPLAEQLRRYTDFREAFRYARLFRLKWE